MRKKWTSFSLLLFWWWSCNYPNYMESSWNIWKSWLCKCWRRFLNPQQSSLLLKEFMAWHAWTHSIYAHVSIGEAWFTPKKFTFVYSHFSFILVCYIIFWQQGCCISSIFSFYLFSLLSSGYMLPYWEIETIRIER